MTNLFKSKADRKLWIKLNAERQIEWEKGLTYFDKESGTNKPTLQALNPRTMKEALEISKRQSEGDSGGKLRYTLEELLTLDREGLLAISDKHHQEWIKKFEALK